MIIMKRAKANIILSILETSILAGCGSPYSYTEHKFQFSQKVTDDYESRMYYTDEYFALPASQYNDSLATSSLSLAMSSFASNRNPDPDDYSQRYRNVKDLLTNQLGFDNFYVNFYYTVKPQTDSLGAAFASKSLSLDGKNYTLIAGGIRGAGYEREWASNVTLGDGKDETYGDAHLGFAQAANIYLNSLKDYIEKNNITGDIKLWTAGYSRAGATCNMAAGRIDEAIQNNTIKTLLGDVNITKDDVYAYCFEAPAGYYYYQDIDDEKTQKFNEDNSCLLCKTEPFNNIHNVINRNDLVPYFSPDAFGFTRYGIDHYLTDPIIDINYKDHIGAVKDAYHMMPNHDAIGEYVIDQFVPKTSKGCTLYNWTLGMFLEEFIDDYANYGMKTRDFFHTKIESSLRDLFAIFFASTSIKSSIANLAITFVEKLLTTTELQVLYDDVAHNQSYFFKDVKASLTQALGNCGVDILTNNPVDMLKGLIDSIIPILSTKVSLLLTFANKNNVQTIAKGHFPELCFAHLQARDPNYTLFPVQYDMSGKYFLFNSMQANQNVKITNSKNQVVALFENGQPVETDSSLPYGVNLHNRNFAKEYLLEAYLPYDDTYTLEISNTDAYGVYEYDPGIVYYNPIQETVVETKDNTRIITISGLNK